MDEVKPIAYILIVNIALVIVAGGIGFCWNRTVQTVDNGILHYEEFQEIYTTTNKINTDLCSTRQIDAKDQMFVQFSKAQRIDAQRKNITRWIEEYNAKSKMINRSLWKSSELPYQLSTANFNCYEGAN